MCHDPHLFKGAPGFLSRLTCHSNAFARYPRGRAPAMASLRLKIINMRQILGTNLLPTEIFAETILSTYSYLIYLL